MNLTRIGRTLKPYGLDGGIKVTIQDEYLEDFLQSSFLFIEQKGQPVPFLVEEIVPSPWMVFLEDIENKDEAEHLSKKPISVLTQDLIPDEHKSLVTTTEDLQYSAYIGFMLCDEVMGELGKIEEIIAYPQQEMAALSYQNTDILLPMNESFIQSVDKHEQKILLSLPEGIIDIQL